MVNSAHKIFISYKYHDSNVYKLKPDIEEIFNPTTVRDYVNKIEDYFDARTDHTYKGEHDDEDLSGYAESTIWEKLKDRIFDSSVTIVLISPNMRNYYKSEKSQWIPWEISFSLKETERNNRISHSNAILAVVLPDRNNDFSYFMYEKNCPGTTCRCTHYETQNLFSILSANLFNAKFPDKSFCDNASNIYYGDHSYIFITDWYAFMYNSNYFIEKAIERKNKIYEYNISKEVY